jgi:hypothetical protein
MDPLTLSLGARAFLLDKRFLPYILASVAVIGAIWLIRDRISDAEARASASETKAASAQASADQWRLASQTQSQSILKLADSYKALASGMSQRDARFENVWRETERVTSNMADRARRLLAIPAASGDKACAVAIESLRDTRGYTYIQIQLPEAIPVKDTSNAK